MVSVYVTSAFSKNNKGGNKAGVVLNRPDLSSVQKMKIAKMLGYSETAFVDDSCLADYKIQYFTPTEEVQLCGHATIAVFSTLKSLNKLDKRNYTIETKAGILNIQVEEDGLIFMEQNCPVYFDVLNSDKLQDCVEKNYISHDFPVQIVSTGLKDIMLPIDTQEHLITMSPNLEMIAQLSKETNVVGIHAFALINSPDLTAICRNFAPLYGINEESATGTSNCALACYLFKYFEKKSRYIFEQGYTMDEISRIVVNISYHENIIDSVYVGGYGYLIYQITVNPSLQD